jgi:hypothetical protein
MSVEATRVPTHDERGGGTDAFRRRTQFLVTSYTVRTTRPPPVMSRKFSISRAG